VRRGGGLLHKPLGDHLPIIPAAAAQHAVADARQLPRGQAQLVIGVTPGLLSIEGAERPLLDADRLEQRLDRELVVRLAGDVLADQGGVVIGVG
jgi:hypothetical protein